MKENPSFKIEGGHTLHGTTFIQGSKNAILPMIAASLLTKNGSTVIKNVPPLNDIVVALDIIKAIGADVRYFEKEQIVVIDTAHVSTPELPAGLTGLLRASVLFTAPLLARMGYVKLQQVGGCQIGERKLDFHHRGFARMGAEIEQCQQGFEARASALKGTTLYIDFPSHTGTENLMMAACLAEGETIIENAASEPEIVDFGQFLIDMGAKIDGLGTRRISVQGVRELHAVEYTAMPDRLDAGALIMAAGITGSKISLVGCQLSRLLLLKEKLSQMGIKSFQHGPIVHIQGVKRFTPINIVTWPYPGFATDLQPGVMTIASLADGLSYFRENLFEARFGLAKWLNKMGADIEVVDKQVAIVKGPRTLQGRQVHADDIRVGMALVLAGLVAEGTTTIRNGYQIERGHYNLDSRLRALGAKITRVP